MTYKVITKDNPLEVWARGFHGDYGKAKAERMIAEKYWHRLMYMQDRHKTLEIVPE
jgi:hypothetical protein